MFVGDGHAETFHDEEEIFPDFAFVGIAAGAEEKRRVVGDHDGGAVEVVELVAEAADGFLEAEESLGGGGAEGDDGAGVDDFDFLEDELLRGFHLCGCGFAIGSALVVAAFDFGAPFYDIGNVDVGALDAHGADNFVEELTGFADEGLLLVFLVGAGGFADEHDLCVRIAGGEDESVAEGAEGFAGGV